MYIYIYIYKTRLSSIFANTKQLGYSLLLYSRPPSEQVGLPQSPSVQDTSERRTSTVDETSDRRRLDSGDRISATPSPMVYDSVARRPDTTANKTFPPLYVDDRTLQLLDRALPDLRKYFSRMSRGMAEGTDVAQGPGRRGRHTDVTPRQVYFVVMWLAHR
jgi:hypothetical protein